MANNLTRRTIGGRATGQSPSITATDDPGRLMTISEVSDLLGIPVATLYRWRHRGEGPQGYRIGRHLRYRRAAIEEWIESRADARSPW